MRAFGPSRRRRGIDRGELRADTDPRRVLVTRVSPIHGRLLLIGEPVSGDFPERLVDLLLHGAAKR